VDKEVERGMKKSVTYILIIILAIIVGLLIGYNIANIFYRNDNQTVPVQTNESEQEEQTETKVWTDEEVQDILSLFFRNKSGMANSTEEMTDSEVFYSILNMVFVDLKPEDYNITTGDYNGEHDITTVPLASVQELAKTYFNHDQFTFAGDTTFNYFAEEEVYRNHGGMGFGKLGPYPTYTVTQVERSDQEYTVTMTETYTEEEKEQFPALQNADKTYTVIMHCDNEICYPVSWQEQ